MLDNKKGKTNWKFIKIFFWVALLTFSSVFIGNAPVESNVLQVNPLAFQLYRATHSTIDFKAPITQEMILDTLKKKEGEYKLPAGSLEKLARCESSLNPQATHKNTNGSIDRGLFQINSKAHYEVSDTCAFDYTCATNWTAQQLKLGRGKMWVCYK